MDTGSSFLKRVDLLCKENNEAHHTSGITEELLIARRGQSFSVTLDLVQPFNPLEDALILTAETGPKPEEERGTRSVFSVAEDGPKQSPGAIAVWKAELAETPGSQPSPPQPTSLRTITLAITPPADCPVGKWSLSLSICPPRGENEDVQKLKENIGSLILLFNAWNKDDSVYMDDEKLRKEYVMNEHGQIYKGTKDFIFPLAWDYGQFEEEMVDICLKLLDVNANYLKDPVDDVSARSDPIYVGRVVSAMINSEDDSGVLVGKWEGDYSDGFRPSHWDGSVDILQRWYENNCCGVKYGQCWVYAGVMCTVLRFLGIPCRVVTNFHSACDEDKTMTIDKFYHETGMEVENTDSIWNFHVWTEAWMKRPDLGDDGCYDGWQVLDPTPQELSDGVHCCGPASVTAIHRGDVDTKYDTRFVFAEVNADVVEWMVKSDGTKYPMCTDTTTVGKKISTKAAGSNKILTITDNYKPKEGSKAERVAFQNAIDRGENMALEEEKANDDAPETNGTEEVCLPKELLISFEELDVMNGEDISTRLKLKSQEKRTLSLSVNITVTAAGYTGREPAKIHHDATEATLEPGGEVSVPIEIPFTVYGKQLLVYDNLRVSAVIKDQQNPEQIYHAETKIIPKDPPIFITVEQGDSVKLGCETMVEVAFTNPIEETLTNCVLTLSGSGLLKKLEKRLPDLKKGQRVKVRIALFPYKLGEKMLVVDLDCSAFRDIKGTLTIEVK